MNDSKQELIQDLIFNIAYNYGTFLYMAGRLKKDVDIYDSIYEWLEWSGTPNQEYYQLDDESKEILEQICQHMREKVDDKK